jgi:hypothetical protein
VQEKRCSYRQPFVFSLLKAREEISGENANPTARMEDGELSWLAMVATENLGE